MSNGRAWRRREERRAVRNRVYADREILRQAMRVPWWHRLALRFVRSQVHREGDRWMRFKRWRGRVYVLEHGKGKTP